MKKGFTLIELLAVIVILAIIALIATPIVLSIIDESKENANLRSAEMYLDAVELAVANKNLEEPFSPSICNVLTDGNLQCGTKTLEIEVNGEKPTSGTIIFKNGKLENYQNLFIGEKYITKGESGAVASNTASTNKILSSICVPADASTVTTGNIPQGAYNNGDEYICEVKKGVTYNFFIVSKDETAGTVNLIMDRNVATDGTLVTEDNLSQVAWCSKEDYDAKNATEASNPDGVDDYATEVNFCPKSNNVFAEEGAITATNAVKLYTSSWDNLADYNYSFLVDPYMVNESKKDELIVPNPAEQSNALQTAIWSPYSLNLTSKARLLTVAEALQNNCLVEVNNTITNDDGTTTTEKLNVNSCPLYLSNYLSHGEKFVTGDKVVDIANLKGYWLLNGGGCYGYVVHNNGSINSKETTNSSHSGIRPVITLNKTDLG